MKNSLKYFGVLENCFEFNKLSEDDQKKALIKHKIYVRGISDKFYNDDLANSIYRDKNQTINLLSKDFIRNKINYTLNLNFVAEVYNFIMTEFENNLLKIVNENIKVLDLFYHALPDEKDRANFIGDNRQKAMEEYLKALNNKIFQDFIIEKEMNSNYQEIVIKRNLIYDVSHLSDYIFGLNNHSNSLIINTLYSLKRIEKILEFCGLYKVETDETELEKLDPKSSIPKSIAMLKVAGFFELENIKKLKQGRLYQIIAIIIGKDPTNITDNRIIRGNYNILQVQSDENPTNFTSSTHLKKMADLLK